MNSLKPLGVVLGATLLAVGMSGGQASAAFAVGRANTAARVATAKYTVIDNYTGHPRSGTVKGIPPNGPLPMPESSLSCADKYLKDALFTISCTGKSRFYVVVDCDNGYRYPLELRGSLRVRLTCPAGSRALSGGAYGS